MNPTDRVAAAIREAGITVLSINIGDPQLVDDEIVILKDLSVQVAIDGSFMAVCDGRGGGCRSATQGEEAVVTRWILVFASALFTFIEAVMVLREQWKNR